MPGLDGVLDHGDQELEEHADARSHEEGGRGDLPDGRRRRQTGEPEGGAGGDQGPQDRVDLVTVGARDEDAGEDRGDEHPDGDGYQEQAGGGGRVPVDHLEVGGLVAHDADHPAHREHADGRGDDEGAVGQDRPGQDGVGGAGLDVGEQPPADQARSAQTDDDGAGPRVLVAAPGGHEDDGDGTGVHEHEPPPVDGTGQAVTGKAQDDGNGDEGEDTQRQVDPEGPAPGDRVGQPPTDDGPQDGGDAEHGSHGGHVGATHARRDEVAGDRLGGDHETAAAQTLDEAVDDELSHGVGGAAQGRADQEQGDGHQEEVLAAHEVAELAVDRHGHGDGQGVGGQDPGHVGGATEVAHDGRQGRADDRLVHGGQEHDHQERGVDRPEAAVGVEVRPRFMEGGASGGRRRVALSHGYDLYG